MTDKNVNMSFDGKVNLGTGDPNYVAPKRYDIADLVCKELPESYHKTVYILVNQSEFWKVYAFYSELKKYKRPVEEARRYIRLD